MFVNDFQERIFQTLPGQGWHVLIDEGEPSPADAADGAPRFLHEPVIAFVTARMTDEKGRDEVIIAPLVRGAATGELDIIDTRGSENRVLYLAPGEELTEAHFAQFGQFWRKGVSPSGSVAREAK
jgi:hypothetical protein